jgi:hypothetical protein
LDILDDNNSVEGAEVASPDSSVQRVGIMNSFRRNSLGAPNTSSVSKKGSSSAVAIKDTGVKLTKLEILKDSILAAEHLLVGWQVIQHHHKSLKNPNICVLYAGERIP